MSSNLVSFTCGTCKATLSISVDLAGISGPCPYCGEVVTSPRSSRVFAPEDAGGFPRSVLELEEPNRAEPRPWFQAQLMSTDETVLPIRQRRTGIIVTIGMVLFASGVAWAWKFWDRPEPEVVAKPAAPQHPGLSAASRLPPRAPAEDALPDGTLPPASDEIPSSVLAGSPAVAHNVSTAASRPPVPIIAEGADPPRPPSRATSGENPGKSGVVSVPAAATNEAEKEIRKVISCEGSLEKPGTALVRFFAAKTWQERLKYSLAPGKIKPLMEAHYKSFPDGPMIPEDIELTRIEPVEEDPARKYFAYIVYMPGNPDGVPLSVEETTSGCLVEWTSFIEGKERMLADFYFGFRSEPRTFRVLARRAHYFENDIPDQDRKVVYDLFPPESSGPYKMWVDKDSVAYTRYFATGPRAEWRFSSMMVLTLQWEKAPNGTAFVRLREVVAESWHPAMLPSGTAGR